MTVKQIQCLLTYLGYAPGEIDGVNGLKTTAAVLVFQAQEGLEQDGKPGSLTQAKLLDAVAEGRLYEEVPSSGQPPDTESPDDSTSESGDGTFWDGIEFFKREEWRCQCGGKFCNGFPAEPAEETVRMCDEIRRRAGVPITISSGLRCPTHNAEVGGVSNSRHMTGQAADMVCSLAPAELYRLAVEVAGEQIPGRGGIGLYSWGVHIDNGTYSRWNG